MRFLLAGLVMSGCASGSTSQPTKPEPRPLTGDGWSCFHAPDGASTCQNANSRCDSAQASVQGATACARVASVWCIDRGPERAPECVASQEECGKRAAGASCVEETLTPMEKYEQLRKKAEDLEHSK